MLPLTGQCCLFLCIPLLTLSALLGVLISDILSIELEWDKFSAWCPFLSLFVIVAGVMKKGNNSRLKEIEVKAIIVTILMVGCFKNFLVILLTNAQCMAM
jgi:phosphoglycerol transferase MdoB-like AlkP superfamily enzyme